MNFTNSYVDTERYSGTDDLKAFYREFGLDGIELMRSGGDELGIITPDDVIGVHMRYFTAWMDLWTGNENRLLEEYGDYAAVESYFGGKTKDALTSAFRNNLDFSSKVSPEYLVFHVSECHIKEAMRRQFYYSDEQVIDAAAELVNSFASSIEGSPWLLFENLWYSGLNMQNPDLTRRLLENVEYKNAGVMLDIGHLLNCNTALRTVDDGVDYIHRILDSFGDLSFMKGMHLHQSLSGECAEKFKLEWDSQDGTYMERNLAVLPYIFQIDTPQPFASARVNELIKRITPEYLVLEFLSGDRDEHAGMLRKQVSYLNF
jgi:hypothetical protein